MSEEEHRARHPYGQFRWMWTTSRGDQHMVACRTCGYEEPYDPDRHFQVEDVDY